MFDEPIARYALAIAEEKGSLSIALLTYERNQAKELALLDFSAEESSPLLEMIKKRSLPTPRDFFRKMVIITSITSERTLIRPLEVHLRKKEEIIEALPFQIEAKLPYPPEEAILDFDILKSHEESSLLTVFSVKKAHLEEHLEQWSNRSITPEVVSCDSAAIAAFTSYYGKRSNRYCTLDIGLHRTICLLAEGDHVISSLSFPHGISPLQELLGIEEPMVFPGTSLEKQLVDDPHLSRCFEELLITMQQALFAMELWSFEEFFITGKVALLENLDQLIAARMGKELTSYPTDVSARKRAFAIPIGLAITTLPLKIKQINFRKGEFHYPKPWRRIQPTILTYLSLMTTLTLFVYAISEKLLHDKFLQLEREYLTLLETNPLFEEKTFAEHATVAEIAHNLTTMEEKLEKMPKSFPLMADTPTVTECLAFLSQLPGMTTDGSSTPIILESFYYTMAKRPEKGKPKEPYQVRVEIELRSKDAKKAREFYDALNRSTDIIDTRHEVKGSSQEERYRLSFTFKDRTVYP